MKLNSNNKGFTIIEVLTVMLIGAIIIALGFLGVQNAQRGSRNAQRNADIGSMVAGLQEYIGNNNGSFPVAIGVDGSTVRFCQVATIPGCAGSIAQTSRYNSGNSGDVAIGADANAVTSLSLVRITNNSTCNTSTGAINLNTGSSVTIRYAVENASGYSSRCRQF